MRERNATVRPTADPSRASKEQLLAFFSQPENYADASVYDLPSPIRRFDQDDDWDWGRRIYYWVRPGLRLRVRTDSGRITCVELLDPEDHSRSGTTIATLWQYGMPAPVTASNETPP
ncbi:hypothetical protein ABB29_02800 [Pseudoxanthomonas dokdonensis]|uniref:Uncharacterized protein n=1 Tax=Pseudoxanthomonas dokdonensis TaxID=344882 RepID=A0A0R0D302_9GAMM|nr:hypothetical protein ABB29_02800 [Pseudoxanthomonas dokdonensis]